MNLRSGAFYRSGHQSFPEERSRASTLGSTARTQSQSRKVEEGVSEETLTDSSMDSPRSFASNPGLDLEFDGRLRFILENNHGAKIYRDFVNRFAVKVEDHPTPFDTAPWVNFQEDRYMGRDGSMYLLTEFPDKVDNLGNKVPEEIGRAHV